MTTDSRLDELEARYTLQQRQLEDLSTALWEQQKTLDVLVAEMRSLRERLQSQGGVSPITTDDEGPPPHY